MSGGTLTSSFSSPDREKIDKKVQKLIESKYGNI